MVHRKSFPVWHSELKGLARKFNVDTGSEQDWLESWECGVSPEEALQDVLPEKAVCATSFGGVEDVAKAIGFPTEQWPGNCYGVAYQMIEHGLVKGEAVYGHYNGAVEKGTLFDGRPIVRHGWIETPEGLIIDPTRYVFEGKDPYIYVVEKAVAQEYDVGGDLHRLINERPKPEFSASDDQIQISPDARTVFAIFVKRYPAETISKQEALWVANLSRKTLGVHAKELYSELINKGLSAFIPIDNRRAVIPEAFKARSSSSSLEP